MCVSQKIVPTLHPYKHTHLNPRNEKNSIMELITMLDTLQSEI